MDNRIALVDVDRWRPLNMQGMELQGDCKRCGTCCRAIKCEHLKMENVNNKEQATCLIHWTKPVSCALWPLVGDKIPEGCGYHWE